MTTMIVTMMMMSTCQKLGHASWWLERHSLSPPQPPPPSLSAATQHASAYGPARARTADTVGILLRTGTDPLLLRASPPPVEGPSLQTALPPDWPLVGQLSCFQSPLWRVDAVHDQYCFEYWREYPNAEGFAEHGWLTA